MNTRAYEVLVVDVDPINLAGHTHHYDQASNTWHITGDNSGVVFANDRLQGFSWELLTVDVPVENTSSPNAA